MLAYVDRSVTQTGCSYVRIYVKMHKYSWLQEYFCEKFRVYTNFSSI